MNLQPRSLATAVGLLVAIAFLTPTAAPRASGQPPETAEVVENLLSYLPLALHSTSLGEPPPPPSPTPSSPTPSSPTPSTPSPVTATPTLPPKPPMEHGPVVFQVATYGGLSFDLGLGYAPSQTPWFTLYEDGAYIRLRYAYVEGEEQARVSRLAGQLSEEHMTNLIARLIDGSEFFELPANPPPMICVTDGPDDYLYLAHGGRTQRMRVYGLTAYSSRRWPCPTPWPMDERMVRLAGLVDTLAEPLTEDEVPYEVERGTLVASDRDQWPDPAPPWPFPIIPLASLPGQWYGSLALEGDLARDVLRAIDDHRVYGTRLARFSEAGTVYLVGFRIEFAGWDAYK